MEEQEFLSSLVRSYERHLDEAGEQTPEEFLSGHAEAPGGALEALHAVARLRSPSIPGRKFGPYLLIEELGRGAQATVHLARDTRLGRKVALKILQPTGASGAAPYLRLQREAEAASRLDHPNICTVYEAGIEASLPYIAMQYVEGETLARSIGSGSLADRLARIETVARALHVAHEAGFLHRDIKPGNIMLTRDGEPVLCDFGLARSEDDAAITRTGEMPGTPAYLSPEQLRGAPLDRRSDVYSLGVILYEEVVGARPFEAATLDGLYRRILQSDAALPRSLPKDLRVVLETALEKDRDRRYASAVHLADDLRRVRAHEPIAARPPGPLLRVRRWAQRRPAVAVALFLVSAGTIAFAVQQRRSVEELRAEQLATQRQAYIANIFAADASLRSAEPGDAQPRLDACAERWRDWEWHYLRHKSDSSRACYDGGSRMTCIAASPDGSRIAAGSDDHTIRVWDGDTKLTLEGHSQRVKALAYSPDGRRLASASDDGTVRVWLNGALRHTLEGHTANVLAVAFTTDGSRLCSGSVDRTLRVWDGATGAARRRIRFESSVRAIAAVSDHQVLVGLRNGGIYSADVASGAIAQLARCDDAILGLDVSGDLVAVCTGRSLRVLSRSTGQEVAILRGHRRILSGAAFAPGGRLVTASFDGTVRTWTADGTPLRSQLGHTRLVSGLAVTPAGAWTSSSDGTVRAWSFEPRTADLLLHTAGTNINALAFSPDGRHVAFGTWGPVARVLDVATGAVVAHLRGHEERITEICFDPEGRRIATASTDHTVRVWDATTGECQAVLRGHADSLGGVAFSSDGQRLASCGRDRTVRIWDAATGKRLALLTGHTGALPDIAWDGERIASASDDGTVRIWDAATGDCLAILEGHERGARMPAFHPNGRDLVTAAGDGTVRIWDLSRKTCIRTLRGHTDTVFAVDIHPGGTRVLSVSRDHTARLWDVASGETVLILHGHDALLSCGSFSPDGKRIATGSYDRTIRLWETEPPPGNATIQTSEEDDPERLAREAWELARVPDGDHRRAQEHIDRAVRLSPTPRYWPILGAVYYRLGEYERAVGVLDRYEARQTLLRRSRRPGGTVFLAMALFRAGESARARRTLLRYEQQLARPSYKDDADLQLLLAESRALIRG